ncbi:uncharacterized protein [Nicotiana sylvestris]|uniref:uncharacterized protein n=1 Tax=Nicotiana sylvestris TaxID=4096 RepID=UPI00388CC673
MEALDHFSKVSGLIASIDKFSMFLAGVEEGVRDLLLAKTGFALGTFPIRYLGLPLSLRKWNKIDCQMLVRKITHRITVTCSKQLSYAGRLQIVNAALFSIHSFWGAVFILPQSALKEVDRLYSSWYWRKLNSFKGVMQGWYSQDRYMLTSGGRYSTTSSYLAIASQQPRVEIADLVWTALAQPRHKFVMWLAIQGRLLTKDRLVGMQIHVDNINCSLCEEEQPETKDICLSTKVGSKR